MRVKEIEVRSALEPIKHIPAKGCGHAPAERYSFIVHCSPSCKMDYSSVWLVLAGVAQLVERHLAKVQVAGSNPVSRSKVVTNSPQRIRDSLLAAQEIRMF